MADDASTGQHAGTDMGTDADTSAEAGAPADELDDLSRGQWLRLVARAPDSYVLLLGLLTLDYVMISVEWTGGAALVVRASLFALTVSLAFHTSRVPAPVQKVARVVLGLTVLASVGVAISGGRPATGSTVLLMSLLLLACPAAIGWRLVHHTKVTIETLAGAVCIYVLIGMIFAYLDFGYSLATGTFFAQSGHHGLPDYAYFSYITMATVGYGDLTPTTGLPRTMAVLEALLGQVFLVVLLARLVSLYSGPRGWRAGLRARIEEEEEEMEARRAQTSN